MPEILKTSVSNLQIWLARAIAEQLTNDIYMQSQALDTRKKTLTSFKFQFQLNSREMESSKFKEFVCVPDVF